ncbi:integrase core domain-containing protein [Nitrospira sp. Ecomares 2.1]
MTPNSNYGQLRDECLSRSSGRVAHAVQTIIEAWGQDNNQRRPHSSLGHLTPNEFMRQCQVIQTAETALCSGWKLFRNGTNVTKQKNLVWLSLYFWKAYYCGDPPQREQRRK